MKTIHFFNTLTKQKNLLEPINPPHVTMYHCGPTVYWTQHIGNLRSVVMADMIVRMLEYTGYNVQLVRNYTDVGHLTGDNDGDADSGEDRMQKAATRENTTPESIAAKYIEQYEIDCQLLGIRQPNITPKATDHIKEMQAMTKNLLENGFAYTTDLAVYFDITKAHDYTRLSGQKIENNIAHAGAGSVTDPDKKNQTDFALWFFKAGTHANALQTWPSPFVSSLVQNGEGFPGWHIECSAMARKYLGDTIDIHMGGIEHIPVHHTNEIAQSECATGNTFAHIWLHNEHLTVDGGKMSKSAGTAFSLSQVLEKGFDPLALRYFYLQAHYRSKQNFTWQALTAAQTTLNKLYLLYVGLLEHTNGNPLLEYQNAFTASLTDDCNTPQALAVLWDMLKSDASNEDKKTTLDIFDTVLGLQLQTKAKTIHTHIQNLPTEVQDIIKQRNQARVEKNWELADQLRDQLVQHYWVEDTTSGTVVIPKNLNT